MMLDEDRFRDELKHDYLSTMHPATSTKAMLCLGAQASHVIPNKMLCSTGVGNIMLRPKGVTFQLQRAKYRAKKCKKCTFCAMISNTFCHQYCM